MKQLAIGLAIGAFAVAVYETSPYQGQEQRDIKALSATEVESYLAGDGMGFAKTAELNRYPGPNHVLELSDRLELTINQRQQTQALFDAMKEKASALGAQLVEKERTLDQRFAHGTMDPQVLNSLLVEIGELHTAIRYAHLHGHLKQRALLSEAQAQRYSELRGCQYNAKRHQGH